MESLAHAKKRKARVYAELAGYAATSEAYHMVIPQEDGQEISMTMKIGLESAGIGSEQVDYINAHATSTTIGDAVETKAIRNLFKNRADKIAISATKSSSAIRLAQPVRSGPLRPRWRSIPDRFTRPPTMKNLTRTVGWTASVRRCKNERFGMPS